MRFITLLKRIALNSDHKHYWHGAIVYKGNSVLGIGFNRQKTHPKMKNIKDGRKKHIHAEFDAINKVKKKESLIGATLITIRYNGKLMNGKPCKYCMDVIAKSGIRKITFSNDVGFTDIKIG